MKKVISLVLSVILLVSVTPLVSASDLDSEKFIGTWFRMDDATETFSVLAIERKGDLYDARYCCIGPVMFISPVYCEIQPKKVLLTAVISGGKRYQPVIDGTCFLTAEDEDKMKGRL